MNCKTVTVMMIILAIASAFAVFAPEDGSAATEYDFYDGNGFGYEIIEGTNNVIFHLGNHDVEGDTCLDENDGFRSTVTHGGKTYTVTEIGPNAFYNVGLEEIVLPETVTVIHSNAFYDAGSLTSLNMENIVSIGYWAFYGTPLFEGSVFTIGKNLTDIQPEAFYNTGIIGFEVSPENKSYVIVDDALCTSDMKYLLYFFGTAEDWQDGYTTPDVEIISSRSYCYCPLDCELTISPSVKTIGECAFENAMFSKVTFKNGNLETIEEAAFAYCYDMEGKLEFPSSLKSISLGAFMFTGISGVEFNEGLLYIGDSSFESCGNLSSIVFDGNTVKYIGFCAFELCFGEVGNATAEIEFPSSLEVIGSEAFRYCSGLGGGTIIFNSQPVIGCASFGIGSDLTISVEGLDVDTNFLYISTICSDGGFTNVSGYTTDISVSDPASGFSGVSRDGKTAVLFADGDRSGKHVVFPDTMTDQSNSVYSVIGIITKSGFTAGGMTVPASVEILATIPDQGNFYVGQLQFAQNINLKMIATFAFYGEELDGDITIPDSVICIESSAFANSKISSVNTGGTRYLGSFAFTSARSLKNLTLGPNAEYLGSNCFSGDNISELTIPEKMKIISTFAFNGNQNMEKVVFEGNPAIETKALSFGVYNVAYVEISTPGWNPSELGSMAFGDMVRITKWINTGNDFDWWWLILVMVVIAAGLIYWGGRKK